MNDDAMIISRGIYMYIVLVVSGNGNEVIMGKLEWEPGVVIMRLGWELSNTGWCIKTLTIGTVSVKSAKYNHFTRQV